eukprot:scaffold7727_cov258-Pinguiococcus_pyrenoidosus.AAC.4
MGQRMWPLVLCIVLLANRAAASTKPHVHASHSHHDHHHHDHGEGSRPADGLDFNCGQEEVDADEVGAGPLQHTR